MLYRSPRYPARSSRQRSTSPLNCWSGKLSSRALPNRRATLHTERFHSIDVDSLEPLRPRSVGVEQVGLWAMEQVQLLPLLNRLGFNGPQCAAAVGSIIGRMAVPGSERATYRWLIPRFNAHWDTSLPGHRASLKPSADNVQYAQPLPPPLPEIP